MDVVDRLFSIVCRVQRVNVSECIRKYKAMNLGHRHRVIKREQVATNGALPVYLQVRQSRVLFHLQAQCWSVKSSEAPQISTSLTQHPSMLIVTAKTSYTVSSGTTERGMSQRACRNLAMVVISLPTCEPTAAISASSAAFQTSNASQSRSATPCSALAASATAAAIAQQSYPAACGGPGWSWRGTPPGSVKS